MNVVALGVELEFAARAHDTLALVAGMMFEERGPTAEVVPAELSRDTVDVAFGFATRGARFHDAVVDADVLALRVEALEGTFKLARTVRRGDLFQQRRSLGKVFAHRGGQG